MPRIIKDGQLVDDSWSGDIHSLEDWQGLADKAGSAVQLEPGDDPAVLLNSVGELALVVINFPNFMDGRGFSYGRTLRERGFEGELRARGGFIRDQLTYLSRCGFNAFEMDNEAALESLQDFSEAYQASVDKPLPLFRRRA